MASRRAGDGDDDNDDEGWSFVRGKRKGKRGERSSVRTAGAGTGTGTGIGETRGDGDEPSAVFDDRDGLIVVERAAESAPSSLSAAPPPSEEEAEALAAQIQSLKEKLRKSAWCSQLLREYSRARSRIAASTVGMGSQVDAVVCYGLGNFEGKYSHAPRYQLAAALVVRDHSHGASLSIYEPLTSLLEAAALRRLGVTPLGANDAGKRRIGPDGITVFFMPHCPIRLYSNVLWANWEHQSIGRLLVLGNSWEGYDLSCIDSARRKDPSNCVLKVLNLSEEFNVAPRQPKKGTALEDGNLPHLYTAFNDLAWCFVPAESLATERAREKLRNRPIEWFAASE